MMKKRRLGGRGLWDGGGNWTWMDRMDRMDIGFGIWDFGEE
jgi:hypothetical protein